MAQRVRSIGDLKQTGLLWLINTSVFHPRGFAIALVYERGHAGDPEYCLGWKLIGDGSEQWQFDEDCVSEFMAVETLFKEAKNEDNVENKA